MESGTAGNPKSRAGKCQAPGQWIRSEKRLAIYLRDSLMCLYCGKDLRNEAPENVTLDHLVPRSAGGSNDATNLCTSCRRCNCSRQDRPWMDFAPGFAVERIETRRHQPLNVRLAKSILSGEQSLLVADVEALR
mgnify:CR=1 FL=1